MKTKMSVEEYDEMQRANGKSPHWVVINEKRGAIWKKPFNTEEMAKEEIKHQAKLTGGYHGWEVQKNWHKSGSSVDSVFDSL